MVEFQGYCALCRSPLAVPNDPWGEGVLHLDFAGSQMNEDDDEDDGDGYSPALIDEGGMHTTRQTLQIY